MIRDSGAKDGGRRTVDTNDFAKHGYHLADKAPRIELPVMRGTLKKHVHDVIRSPNLSKSQAANI